MIGGDKLVIDALLDSRQSDDRLLFKNDGSQKTFPMISIISLLLKVAITNDPYSMHAGFKSGIIFNACICLFVFFVTNISFHLFVKTWLYSTSYSYSLIWKLCYGAKTIIIPSLMIIFAYYSISSLCTVQFYESFSSFSKIAFKTDFSLSASKYVITIVISLVTVIPFILKESMFDLLLISNISNFLLIYSCSFVGYHFVVKVFRDGFDPTHKLVYWNPDHKAFLSSFGLFNTAFFIHPFISVFSQRLENATESRVKKLVWLTTLITGLLNFLTGFCGYVLFNDFSKETIIEYFPASNMFIDLAKIGMAVSNVFGNTAFSYYLAFQQCDLIYEKSVKSIPSRIISGVIVIAFNTFISSMPESTVSYFGLLGDICFVFLAFVFPSTFYLRVSGFKNMTMGIVAILIIIILVPISVFQIKEEF